MLDDSRDNRLKYLTEHAIKHLENDNGYFLLVEASQVDWAGHANDIASAMAEMQDLAYTIGFLKTYVQAHPDTLVILTADHSTRFPHRLWIMGFESIRQSERIFCFRYYQRIANGWF